jgi:hypothetical protein
MTKHFTKVIGEKRKVGKLKLKHWKYPGETDDIMCTVDENNGKFC